MQVKRFRAMGAEIAAFLDADGYSAWQALEQVPAWFEEWEQALSRFRADSELSRLNACAGAPFALSPILSDALACALRAAEWTGGLISPTILDALEAAGYDRSLELLLAHAGGSSSPSVPGRVPVGMDAWRFVQLDEETRSVCLPAGLRLDLGGVGKGWAAHQAMTRLAQWGPALVDAGGDLAVSDFQRGGQPWPVAVADPLQAQDRLALLALPGCGVATSGLNRRRWMKDGAWMHHVIDPRSGQPAETDLLSVSIIAVDTMQAETAARMVLILGSQAGTAWLEEQPGLSGCLAFPDGNIHFVGDFHAYVME